MSFAKRMKRNGPRTDPCGTPALTSLVEERFPLFMTL
jgi:hypothetical protein